MNLEPLDQRDDLVIVGLALRTAPELAMRDIPGHWERFLRDVLGRAVPAGDVYAVYCDYERDHRGPYTMVLGGRVDAGADIPAGLRRVRIPAGAYARVAVSGHPAEVVWRTWSFINEQWPARGRRRYLADYERYDARALAPDRVDVEIAVGVA